MGTLKSLKLQVGTLESVVLRILLEANFSPTPDL